MSTDPSALAYSTIDQPAPSAFKALLELIGDQPVRFWMCAKDGHGSSRGGPWRETVRWIDGIAYCTTPGCGRTSLDPQPELDEDEPGAP